MFSGKSMKAAPGFSVCATLNALRTISGTISGSRICAAYLVIGWNRLHQIEDLVALLVQARGRALPGDRHHRRAIHVRVRHAGDEVGRARPQRGQAHARLAGQPAVDVGHEGRTLLVARGDEPDRLSSSASMTSMFSSPGTPKMYSTPSFSRHLTSSSAAVVFAPVGSGRCDGSVRGGGGWVMWFSPPMSTLSKYSGLRGPDRSVVQCG